MPERIELVPAILAKNYDDLVAHLSRVRGLVKAVQLDVCDGAFVPSKTFPFVDRGRFDAILSQDEGMPMWDEFEFEIDLMVTHSAKASDEWVRAGASRIIVHAESPDDRAALEQLQPLRDEYGVGVDVGLAISLDTPLSKLETLAPLVTSIQCMGIAQIGLQGEPLDDRVVARITQCATLYPQHIISVDGGVTIENAKKLADAGARRLAIGSHLFSGDVRENLQRFKAALA